MIRREGYFFPTPSHGRELANDRGWVTEWRRTPASRRCQHRPGREGGDDGPLAFSAQRPARELEGAASGASSQWDRQQVVDDMRPWGWFRRHSQGASATVTLITVEAGGVVQPPAPRPGGGCCSQLHSIASKTIEAVPQRNLRLPDHRLHATAPLSTTDCPAAISSD